MLKKLARCTSSACSAPNNFLRGGFLGASIVLLWLSLPTSGVAHSGGLDKNGCHNNNTKHDFECHSGLLKGQSFKSREEALKALDKKKKELAAGKKSSASSAKPQTTPKKNVTGGK